MKKLGAPSPPAATQRIDLVSVHQSAESATAFDHASEYSNGMRVEIPKAAQVLAARIRRRIVDGDLRFGDRLAHEAELTASFGVSRPIVREALRILESERFIKLARGARKGATITEPTPGIVARAAGIALRMKAATLGDVYEARAFIEPAAARFAASRRPKEASSALCRQVAHLLKVADDRPKFLRAVSDFHRILLEECGNTTLAVMGQALKSVGEAHLELIRERGLQARSDSGRMTQAGVRSHQRLIDLIAARDAAGAEAHWQIHMNAGAKYWLDGLSRSSVVDIPN